jgi:Fic family protein
MKYNWQQEDWPEFRYDLKATEERLWDFASRSGRVTGALDALPEERQLETLIEIMVSEAIKTSEIEGEYLDRRDVMSSIQKNMGFLNEKINVRDKRAEGIGMLISEVRKSYDEPLTVATLFSWHAMVMEGNNYNIQIGKWRTNKEPMQVISGAMGKEKVHFEAPPSTAVPEEMKRFIEWFNATAPGGKQEIRKAPLRSAIAHLYFESIHPFEDGNGRVGRAIAEKALAQSVDRPVLISLSASMEAEKKEYYAALERAQQSNEITPWINYFVQTVLNAQVKAEELIEFTLKKARFFDKFESQLNDRQLKVIRRMLHEGPDGFQGGMNARKYFAIAKVSKATATRDLQDLLQKDVFVVTGGGRSTSYELNF